MGAAVDPGGVGLEAVVLLLGGRLLGARGVVVVVVVGEVVGLEERK